MLKLEETLKLYKCPHCSVDTPNIVSVDNEFSTSADNGSNKKFWRVYKCMRCGGVITACTFGVSTQVDKIYPEPIMVNEIIPFKVRNFLQQAINSVNSPSGAVMLCACSVDAMLKELGFSEGSLYSRINKSCEKGIITKEMSTWAHQIRLDANDQRHVDEDSTLPSLEDASNSIEFTKILAEILFVIPAKISSGIRSSSK